MEIGSALNSGLQGFQAASNDVTQAATDIARQTAQPTAEQQQAAAPSEVPSNQAVQPPADVTQSIVSLQTAQNNAQASARVIESADETLGTIIDTRA